MKLKKAIKQLREALADDQAAYNRGFEAAMLHLDSSFNMGDREGYERGFKDGYDAGHGVATGALPQPAINEPFVIQNDAAALSDAYEGDSGDEDVNQHELHDAVSLAGDAGC